jgi:hypothetical protein
MKVKHAGAAGLILLIILLGGCQSQRMNLTKQGLYSVDKTASKTVEILWADVYKQEGQVTANGAIRRRHYASSPLKTHIDVQVLSSDGRTVYKTQTPDMYVPPRRVGKGIDFKRFSVELPQKPPQDATVHLLCHAGAHGAEAQQSP